MYTCVQHIYIYKQVHSHIGIGTNRHSICIYTCILYIYVCMHACMHACMHVCMYVCMHACMYACMHVCMYVWVHACMYLCMHASICICTWACSHMDTCMHKHCMNARNESVESFSLRLAANLNNFPSFPQCTS